MPRKKQNKLTMASNKNELLLTPNQIGSTILFMGIVGYFLLTVNLGIKRKFIADGIILTAFYIFDTFIIAFYLFITAWLPEASTRFVNFARNSNRWLRFFDLFLRVITYLLLNLLFVVANKIFSNFEIFPWAFLGISVLCIVWDVIMSFSEDYKDYVKLFITNDIWFFVFCFLFVLFLWIDSEKVTKVASDDKKAIFLIYLICLVVNLKCLLWKKGKYVLKSFGLLKKSILGKPQKEPILK